MKVKFLPTTLAGKIVHVMEESAEVILAVSKIHRFGLDNEHPDTKESNRAALKREMRDLKFAITRLEKVL
jgi:phosphoribosyl-ATP pyrophosphohydrolase